MLEKFFEITGWLGSDLFWGPWTFFGLMAAGIIFTIWTKFAQYTAATHGFAVIRGVYDDPKDRGAINHFQALSAALSATVGLGNISGVALAIAAGGPGALFWMWIIGVFGMALKTVEITLSQMYRNVDEPENPHGGAMWVVEKVIVRNTRGIVRGLAKTFAVLFCITLLVYSFTGGNMFQSWSVADLSKMYWDVPPLVTGILLAIVVGLVIVGGIKRIGIVAARLVPFMCILYLLSALSVLAVNLTEIPSLLALIVKSAFTSTEAGGAFLGGTLGWAFSTGLRRAIFSNEAGLGSAPIAHAAAKTEEPAREGIIGGIGPLIDTLIICTLTALVILSTGTWNRPPLLKFDRPPAVSPVFEFENSPLEDPVVEAEDGLRVYMIVTPPQTGDDVPPASPRMRGELDTVDGELVVKWATYNAFEPPTEGTLDVMTRGELEREDFVVGTIAAMPAGTRAMDLGNESDPDDDRALWGILTAPRSVEIPDDEEFLWEHLGDVFTVVEAERNPDANTYSGGSEFRRWKLTGEATLEGEGRQRTVSIDWGTLTSAREPALIEDAGMWRDYNGASLTAHAFDRQFPGLGKILVPIAAWLFAISTMISWSYYGEQGMIYMLGQRSVLPYKLLYLACVLFAANWITDTRDMENLMDLGSGAMLWSNIPIVLCLGFLAVRALNTYRGKLRAGEFPRRGEPSVEDVVSGKDVE
ncbi:MAG: amino acid carrier protein [Planctomycetota bacterium]|nr:amino acid carrier protein [Planctomycetota bacterium]